MKNGDELINRKIPEGVPIFGFMGHSYGGELAYRMAMQWSQKHNEKPHVYLKDTDINAGNVTPTNIEARKTTNDTKIESSDWSGTDYILRISLRSFFRVNSRQQTPQWKATGMLLSHCRLSRRIPDPLRWNFSTSRASDIMWEREKSAFPQKGW